MITEDYVSFEVAKLLKEKGFNYQGFDYIDFEGEVIRQDRPTLQMVMKWLREIHHIIFVFKPSYFSGDECTYWSYERWCGDNFDGEVLSFKTYEEACEAALKYTLENLI